MAEEGQELVDLSSSGEALEKPFVDYITSQGGREQAGSGIVGKDLIWYDRWLRRQLKKVPASSAKYLQRFPEIFKEVAKAARTGCSIPDISKKLQQLNIVEAGDSDGEFEIRRLIFAIIGWQTMLYEAAFQTCPPPWLAIEDVLDGYIGYAYMEFKQDEFRIDLELSKFLLGFGVMLPAKNACLSEDKEDKEAFENTLVVNPQELNADLLCSIARVNIKWIDVLAPHLEYDKATNTLFLFRYPSFCMANIPLEKAGMGVIYGCAFQHGGYQGWASEGEIEQYLGEIILSYRLLFGQSKSSRRLFGPKDVFETDNSDDYDPLLLRLCQNRIISLPPSIKERELYRLHRDFPVLRSRITALQQKLLSSKPRGWKEIWKDKRDSGQWYTFWAVMFFGGLGITLTLVQVALQAAQLAIEAGGSANLARKPGGSMASH